jgi:solute:Na+ symporter, SSS family
MPTQRAQEKNLIPTDDIHFGTSALFNVGALAVVAILVALCVTFW